MITADDAGKSVLEFLRVRTGMSRAMLRHLKFIEDGITVGGSHVTVRYILKEGDSLAIKAEDEEASEKIAPVELPVKIAFEDSELVVPDKPPFMPTHPSRDHYGDTLANALAFRYKDESIPFVFRPVNRLDRNTSGLCLVAKNRIAASKLFLAMKSGDIEKRYIAVLDGALPEREGEIKTYIGRTPESIIVRRVCKEGEGDLAITRYRVLYENDRYSIVEATPVTGRTHQLRVHFSHLGAPIVGDELYGNESPHISRHALHAASLSFPHPETKEKIELVSPLHDDMRSLINTLFDGDMDERKKKVTENFFA